MADLNELKIKISGDAKDFKAAIDLAFQSADGLNDGLQRIGKASAVAFAALTASVGFSVAAFREQEAATNKLSAVFAANNIQSDALIKKYAEQASALQAVSVFGDETIISAQAQIQQYVGATEVTKELTQATLDFAQATGKDLDSAAIAIGKTIGSSTNALARYGIELEEGATQSQKLQAIVEQLNGRFAGQAEAATKGLGAISQLKNAFSDLQEELGARFAPIITSAASALKDFFVFIQQNPGLVDLAAGITAAAIAITGLITVIGGASAAIFALSGVASALGIGLAALAGPVGIAVAAVGLLAGALGFYAVSSNKAKDASSELAKELENAKEKYDSLAAQVASGQRTIGGSLKADLQQAKEELEDVEERMRKLGAIQSVQNSAVNTEIEKQASEERILIRQQEAEKKAEIEFNETLRRQEQQVLSSELDLANQEQKLALLVADFDKQIAAEESFQAKLALVKQKALAQDALSKQKEINFEKQKNIEIEADRRSSLSTIAGLQNSNNRALAFAGKAAALTQIAIDGPVAVTKAYAAFSPPANFIAAAAVGAAVAAQAARVAGISGFAEGGLVTGGQRGIDSVPAMLTPGELVVPTQNFDEVISAVSNQRQSQGSSGGGGGMMEVIIGFTENAFEIIEQKVIERRATGVGLI